MQHLPRRSGHERYPIPESAPTYEPSDERSPSQFHSSLADYAEYAFVLVAALMTLWLGAMMVAKSLTLHWTAVPWFIGCWLILAYIALPRMHQFFTALYVPDYFIARTRTADGLLGDPVNLALEGSAAERARPSQPNTDEPASASTDNPSQASTNPSPHLSTSIAALGMMWSISSDRMREWVTAPARLAADQVDSPHHPST